ncbi:MAG: hypothetical protein GY746_01275, partial [Gammaproteobacteria bacterium]|nr:hypothetical protein [Gammaproteobacteria bacterium]
MKTTILTTVLVILSLGLFAQVSINTDGTDPDGSAMLDVKSTDKGMLVPRMTTAQRTAISSPATGLLVFDKTIGGFWFYNGSSWNPVGGGWIISGTDMYSAVSGNVGIGATTPQQILHLKKTGASDMTYVRFESGANTNGIDIGARGGGSLGIIQRDAFSIDFFTDETQRMQITADGNVGIGATAPESSAMLEVK